MEDPAQIVEQPAATMEEEAQQQVIQEEAVAIDAHQDIQYNMAAQEAAQQQYEGYQGQPTAEQYAMAAEQQMQEQQELLQNQQYVQEQERLQAEAMMSKQMSKYCPFEFRITRVTTPGIPSMIFETDIRVLLQMPSDPGSGPSRRSRACLRAPVAATPRR